MNNQVLKSPYPLLDRICYCCDSHHMKRFAPVIWFSQPGKTYRGYRPDRRQASCKLQPGGRLERNLGGMHLKVRIECCG